jgi:deoxyribonuclease-4
MRFGAHVSIGRGLEKAVEKAGQLGCEAVQIFSSNPNSWQVSSLGPVVAEAFRIGVARFKISPVVLHTPYLLNLASGNDHNWHLSWKNLASALARAEALGAQYVVTHIGSHVGEGFESGADRVRDAVIRALDAVPGGSMVLLEGGSGAGNTIGSTFEEQAALVGRLGDRIDRVGICLDTAHLWGAGYDLSSGENVDSVIAAFDRAVGIDRLKVLHLNDTQKDLGSHADRHWHIGQGNIGLEGFSALVNHPLLSEVAGIIETPEMELGKDTENLEVLRNLRRNS